MTPHFLSALLALLPVQEPDNCAPYKRSLYDSNSQALEVRILTQQPLISFYTGRVFHTTRNTEIEHIVAVKEAHISGLCAQPNSVKKAFGKDLLNLTLAAKGVNIAKSDKDAAQWRPPNPGAHC